MQTAATTNALGGRVVKETIVGIFSHTIRTSGFMGLYKGVSAPLVAVTPLFALSFWSYDMSQRLICYAKSTNASTLTITDKCIAGGLSAIPTAALMIPSERIKVLMQTAAPGQYRGMMDCATQVYRTGGIQSIFRGTGLTLLRDVPGSIAWFGMYEAAKIGMIQAQGLSDTSKLSPTAVLSAGGLAGIACWIVQIPFDTLKSRYQSAPDGTYPGGAREVLTRLIRNEGAGALFNGIRPALLRAFPANAACFYGMEVSKKFLAFMD
jgi:solute carrier family 25 (mitochondrial carnitine/acylcarnitine transporter), member 20/29